MTYVPVSTYAPLIQLGSEWGGWVVPDDLIDDSWVCYCVGAGSDVSFDLALIQRYGARVRCVDPFHVFREQAESQAAGDARFSFHEVALASSDGPLTMYGAEDPRSGSLSAVDLYGTKRHIMKPGRTLPSLMAEQGDERVDLLKVDIEGSEYEVLPKLDLPSLGVRVLCVELHAARSVRAAHGLIDSLAPQGYWPIHRRNPATYTLLDRAWAQAQRSHRQRVARRAGGASPGRAERRLATASKRRPPPPQASAPDPPSG